MIVRIRSVDFRLMLKMKLLWDEKVYGNEKKVVMLLIVKRKSRRENK